MCLGISRNAVHKHVKSLRKRGYRIVGVSRRGYRLEDEPARLSMGHVTQRTENSMFGHSFRYHDEIESTNLEAKSLAMKGAPEGTVVVAEAQSGRPRPARAGAGPRRRARASSSPSSCGRALPMSEAHLLTIVAATAAAEAIERHVPARVAIKWPNDLFIGDRKVGGILMEVSGEQDEVDWVVLGIGLNVNTEFSELPVALRRTATSLKIVGGDLVDRSEVLANLLLSSRGELPGGAAQRLRQGPHRVPRHATTCCRAPSAWRRGRARWSAPPPVSTTGGRSWSNCRIAGCGASTPAT